MTTPKREQILQLAIKLFHNERARCGDPSFNITPTENELKEDGFYSQAVSELMRDNVKAECAKWQNYNENLENSEPFNVNMKELFESGCLVLGSKHTGKSDIAMMINGKAISENAVVVVFDPSLDWIARSSVKEYVKVEPHTVLDVPNESVIYDLSLCSPNQAQQIVESFSAKLFQHQAETPNRKQYLVIFEEAHTYFYQNVMRSKNAVNSVRMLSVGRNVSIATVLVSQFASMLDKFAIKHSTSQAWFGFTREPNDLKYLRQILGKNADQLKDLQNGEFLYLTRNSLSKIVIQPYENNITKTQIFSKIPQLEPIQLKQSDNNGKTLVSIASALIGLFFVVLALSQGGV